MTLAQKRIWLEDEINNPAEPIFHSTASSHIEVVSIKVRPEEKDKVEKELLKLTHELWQHDLTNDIKILKSTMQSEFLLIGSWRISKNQNGKNMPFLKQRIKPMIAEGIIVDVQSKTDEYLIIE